MCVVSHAKHGQFRIKSRRLKSEFPKSTSSFLVKSFSIKNRIQNFSVGSITRLKRIFRRNSFLRKFPKYTNPQHSTSIVVNDDDKDDDEYHQFRAISARCFPVTATAVVRVVYIGLNSVGRKRIYFFPSFPPAPHSPSFALTIPRFFLHAVFINTGNKNNGRRFKSRQNTLMA